MTSEMVKFTKLRTAVDPSFWAKLAELKLDKYKLEDKVRIYLWGSYNVSNTQEPRTNPMVLDCTSFNESIETTSHDSSISCTGYLINTNTYESFRQTNPEEFIDSMGQNVVCSISDGRALREPWRLTFFTILSYADLKKYRFHYWAAYPTPFSLPELNHVEKSRFAATEFSAKQMEQFKESFDLLNGRSKSFFTVVVNDQSLKIVDIKTGVEHVNSPNEKETVYFAFWDPCRNSEPGWPLRNLLCLLFLHATKYAFEKTIKIISVRGSNLERAIVFTIKTNESGDRDIALKSIVTGRFVGWETNSNGKMGPNIADLSDTMDPLKLAERAVYFNLKLMKWRLVPELNLEKISSLRCLLLGAGTLGCSAARALIGWGIKSLTLVDNGTVSHSNTVRQSLYEHEDAVKRRPKAEAAAQALRRICPTLNVQSSVFQIPMPGHVVGECMMKSTIRAIEALEELIKKHDVVFLLLDSREARWLPTLMCASYNKIAINAALGFDSYTVQRHGTRDSSAAASPDLALRNPSGRDLGCYFCNDVTQPGNSQIDRTLDQQCTVSRPGLSQIAAGLAVELLISLTQHSEGIEAPAFMDDNRERYHASEKENCIGLLGGVPHTIRGSLWSHEMRLTITHRFPSCTACSVPLIGEYRKRGFSFILDACNEPNYLEKLAGLEDLLKRPDLDELCYALSSSSSDEETEAPGAPKS
ncbi:ubiquitin-like modifier-activating enzyme ATG7 isoform X2 [Venturia canescens]|nr:ubiquitin-like modifier-activating enzyme ATG7 isoform X2 [Venturia canescens]XP_043285457.1 ubiquitin-like modifier-activating enzyme ATG7 isoform X2 [Venturia canescens]XP_043285468.1 ubiquitin-like modifier-activating enzyme ATG7 isoform X2 [Venturia canescens]